VLLKQWPPMQIAQRLKYAMQYRCRYALLTISLQFTVWCGGTHTSCPGGRPKNLFVRIIEGPTQVRKIIHE
jgi:hypothetical protein